VDELHRVGAVGAKRGGVGFAGFVPGAEHVTVAVTLGRDEVDAVADHLSR